MNKEDISSAREIIKDFEKISFASINIKHEETFSYYEENEGKTCKLEDLDIIKKTQFLNSAFMNARATESIYVCLGGYYEGMGPNRKASKEIFKRSSKKGLADMFYYINIENDRDRLCIRKFEKKNFEKKNIIIHLNKTDIVTDNFNEMEEKFNQVKLFYLEELLKSDFEEEDSIIALSIVTKIKQKDYII